MIKPHESHKMIEERHPNHNDSFCEYCNLDEYDKNINLPCEKDPWNPYVPEILYEVRYFDCHCSTWKSEIYELRDNAVKKAKELSKMKTPWFKERINRRITIEKKEIMVIPDDT